MELSRGASIRKVIIPVLVGAALASVATLIWRNHERTALAETLTGEFKSSSFGYTLRYPDEWTMDTVHSMYPVDYLQNTSGTVRMFIDVSDDPATSDYQGREVMQQNIKEAFSLNKKYKLDSFRDTTFKHVPAFIMSGWRQGEDFRWYFKQYVIFLGASGRVYNVTANVREDAPRQLRTMADVIIDTLVMPVPSVTQN